MSTSLPCRFCCFPVSHPGPASFGRSESRTAVRQSNHLFLVVSGPWLETSATPACSRASCAASGQLQPKTRCASCHWRLEQHTAARYLVAAATRNKYAFMANGRVFTFNRSGRRLGYWLGIGWGIGWTVVSFGGKMDLVASVCQAFPPPRCKVSCLGVSVFGASPYRLCMF